MKRIIVILSLLLLFGCKTDSKENGVIDSDLDGIIDSADCAPNKKDGSVQLTYLAVDLDRDGHKVKQSGKICTNGKLPDNYFSTISVTEIFDCDDTNALIWKSVYAYSDKDGDGVGLGKPIQACIGNSLPTRLSYDNSDCNDSDSLRWKLTSYKSVDNDLDGIKRSAQGSLCTNGSLPTEFSPYPLVGEPDCNDANKQVWKLASVYKDNDGDGIGSAGVEQQCVGKSLPQQFSYLNSDCNDADSNAWVNTQYHSLDSDLDGFRVAAKGSLCTNGSLPAGFYLSSLRDEPDCDDTNKNIWQQATIYADSDGDGVGAGESILRCIGESLPLNFSFNKSDCDDTNKKNWKDLLYNSIDADLDGVKIAAQGYLCTDGSLPAGYSSYDLYGEPDCDDANKDIWQQVTRYFDIDGDGIGSGSSIQQCIGKNNELPKGLSSDGYDCNERDADKWRKVVVYADIDGDLVGSGAGQVSCIGTTPSDGYSILGYDPLDTLSDPESPNITNFDLPSSVITAIKSDAL